MVGVWSAPLACGRPRPTPSSRPRAHASCASGGFLRDWDVPGASSELRSLRESSPDACCGACVADSACAAWVWRGGDCWLKGDARALQQGSGGLVAGYVRGLQVAAGVHDSGAP